MPGETTNDRAWQELHEGIEALNKVEAKFNRQLNAIRAGKLTITSTLVLDDDDSVSVASPPKKKGVIRKGKDNRAAAERESKDLDIRVALPPVPEKRAGDSPSNSVEDRTSGSPRIFGDYIGLTTSDFAGARGSFRDRRAGIVEKIEAARRLANGEAEALRAAISEAIGGPCYGNRSLGPKLEALRQDPQLFADLMRVVALYRKQTWASHSLIKLETEVSNSRRCALPEIRKSQTQPSGGDDLEKEMRSRRRRVHQRLALEKYVTVPDDVPEVKREEVVGKVVAGTIPMPRGVMTMQRAANWLIMVQLSRWLQNSTVRSKRLRLQLPAVRPPSSTL
eukprot:GGOE01018497.1.p1 GENE.GGOE01018497.1~~GGOE01018497.1.p1  ORF type:complete len:336 (+),score=60.45 GGOE01018497.1:118-1125(+)